MLWLLIITLIPSMTVLAIAGISGTRAAKLLGASGSWAGVTETGRNLITLVERDPNLSRALREAARRHREQLSKSLTQARRWEFIGSRMRTSLPLFFIVLAIFAAAVSIFAARRMARSVSRPIRELVDWTGMLAREARLPEPTRREAREVKELQALRAALRNASEEIALARARAIESERTRNWGEMARRVAHEMKNPLTPLRLAAHRLNSIASSSAELGESITVINEETYRLEELAAQFAMLGRPASGPGADIDIAELLDRLFTTDVGQEIETALTMHAPAAAVHGDYNSLVQAFRNIVRNAVEAVGGTAGARIEVEIRERGRDLEIIVRDNGHGIGIDDTDRIFEPDYTSKPGGTGLGLAIARQTFRAHGGDVTAKRTEQGTEFIVSLPHMEKK